MKELKEIFIFKNISNKSQVKSYVNCCLEYFSKLAWLNLEVKDYLISEHQLIFTTLNLEKNKFVENIPAD